MLHFCCYEHCLKSERLDWLNSIDFLLKILYCMSKNISVVRSWDYIIKPYSSFFELNLKELWHARDLIRMFVKRHFILAYKQTILGPLWFIIQPIFTTLMFMFIFGKLAGIPTDGVPHILFYMSGIVCWAYFADCLVSTSETFRANKHIFGKVYFPRLSIPVCLVIFFMIKFGVQFGLLWLIYIYYLWQGTWYGIELTGLNPNLYLLLLPVLLLAMAALGMGFGLIAASLTNRYRDLIYLVSFIMQLWMYITPIIYPLSKAPSEYRWILIINPVSAIIETFKYAMFSQGTLDWYALAYSFTFAGFILYFGILIFHRVERDFIDVI